MCYYLDRVNPHGRTSFNPTVMQPLGNIINNEESRGKDCRDLRGFWVEKVA